MTVARLLRQTRRARGLSQRSFAQCAAIAQPSLAAIESGAHDTRAGSLDRLLATANYGLYALPTRAGSAADWADEIYQELRSTRASEGVALRALIGLSDDLAAATPDVRVALCVAPAPPTTNARFDAAIAAVVAYHLSRDGLPVPSWVNEPSRALASEWLVTPGATENEVPREFAERGVWLAASELASV